MNTGKPEIFIGIDPDVKASGFAVWHSKMNEFRELSCLDMEDIFTAIAALNNGYKVLVRLEAGWKAKGKNWHKGGYGSANDVGRNHEIGRQIEKFCIKHSVPYQLVLPQGYSSYSHEMFCAATNWPPKVRTNPETRVAGMLCYKF